MRRGENPFFSIIIVCLNPGEKLRDTLESVERQTFRDFEAIVKDGLSTDGSFEEACRAAQQWTQRRLAEDLAGDSAGRSLRVIRQKDAGIYEAMNQGALKARGRYVYFLNCGDLFYSETVLEEMADFIEQKTGAGDGCGIFYGNIFERVTGQKVASNPRLDAFGCYRNVPCHQACFYARELLAAHPFETAYRVRADYEQFLWCFFGKSRESRVIFACRDMLIADYEGGGFSETGENRRISAREHREITGKYLSRWQLFRFRLIMLLSLSRLRAAISHNKRTAGGYNRLKEKVYLMKR